MRHFHILTAPMFGNHNNSSTNKTHLGATILVWGHIWPQKAICLDITSRLCCMQFSFSIASFNVVVNNYIKFNKMILFSRESS